MRTLNLKVQGGLNLRPNIILDGKSIAYKRDKSDNINIAYETEKDSVELKIENCLEIMGKGWWIIQMLFFVFSCFGILNTKIDRNCFEIVYLAKITLDQETNEGTLKLNQTKDKARAVDVLGEAKIEEEKNEYSINEVAKKRRKIMKISYILSWIALVAVAILVICLKIGG